MPSAKKAPYFLSLLNVYQAGSRISQEVDKFFSFYERSWALEKSHYYIYAK